MVYDKRKCVESKNCRILQLVPSASSDFPSCRAVGEVQCRAHGAALYPEQGEASQGLCRDFTPGKAKAGDNSLLCPRRASLLLGPPGQPGAIGNKKLRALLPVTEMAELFPELSLSLWKTNACCCAEVY